MRFPFIMVCLVALLASCAPADEVVIDDLAGSQYATNAIFSTPGIATRANLATYQGDYFSVIVTYTQNVSGSWSAVNLSNASLNFTAKNSTYDTSWVLQTNGTVINASAGTFSINLTETQTLTLERRNYDYEIKATLNDGHRYTVARGKLLVY